MRNPAMRKALKDWSARSGRVWLMLAFLLYGLAGLGAQEQTAELPERHCLWRIQSPTGTVYLLGSVHVLRAEHYPLSAVIERAFAESRRLILEVKLDAVKPQRMQETILVKGRLAPGQTLKEVLAPAHYAQLSERAAAMAVPIQALDPFKPWMAALTLTMMKLRQLGYDPRHGVDQYFTRKAQEQGKDIEGLESFEFQFNLFERLPARLEEQLLLQTLEDMDVIEKQFDSLIRAWRRGDSEGLEEILSASFRGYPEIYKLLVVDRNREWLGQIEKFLAQNETTMVVVGAGHLVGREGLVELLRAKGHRVEQW
jgi:uncharacterized protein YbaP (TraB family)